MGVPTSEVGYTPAMPRREDHEVHEGHVVEFGGGLCLYCLLLHALHCFLFGKVAEQNQVLHSEERYQKNGIKLEKLETGTKLARDLRVISGPVPENPGRMFTFECMCVCV